MNIYGGGKVALAKNGRKGKEGEVMVQWFERVTRVMHMMLMATT